MEKIIKQHFENLHNKDATSRYNSFQFIINFTNEPVDWAYEVWEELLALTTTRDNHQRTIAVQLLSSLAKSDPEERLLEDLDKLVAVTKDEKFVTARHSLQCLWRVGIVSQPLRDKLVEALSKRFKECIAEKNCTLIRYDILEVFKKIFEMVKDEKLKSTALALIQTEQDEKYRKKYAALWKHV